MKPRHKSAVCSLIHLAFATAAAASLTGTARAASGTWSGATSVNWADAGNWSASPVPGTGDTATFNGAGGGNTIVDLGVGGVTVGALLFDTSSAASYSIGTSASQILTLSTNNLGITVNAGVANPQQIPAALRVGAAGTATNGVTNNSTGLLTLSGGFSASVSGAKTLAFAGSGNITESGAIANGSGTVALTKAGSGTLVLSGNSTHTGTNTIQDRGTVNLTGSLLAGNNGAINVGTVNASASVLNISNNVTSKQLAAGGGTTGAGAIYQTAGDVNFMGGAADTTFSLGGVSTTTNGYGYYKMAGGTLTGGRLLIGARADGSTGVMEVTGGTTTVTEKITLGRGNGAGSISSLLNVTGGQVNFGTTTAASVLELGYSGGTGNAVLSVLNVGGGAGAAGITGAANASGGVNLAFQSQTAATGVVNLLANGTLTVPRVTGGNASNAAYLNFNGGKLKATSTNSGATFLASTNIDAITIYNGGGTIDNSGTAITIGNVLKGATGSGVSGIAVSNGGAGYVAPPFVSITGGTGTGATAYATVAGGQVTGIVISSPGSGYVDGEGLTITLTGGGASTPATLGAVTFVDNAAGSKAGMTFAGASGGVTTLAASATYGGPTAITGGSLLVAGTNSLPTGSNVTVDGSTAKLVYTGSAPVSGALRVNQGGLDGTTADVALPNLGNVVFGSNVNNSLTNGAGGTGVLGMNALTFEGSAIINARFADDGTGGFHLNGGLLTSGTPGAILVNVNRSSWPNGVVPIISIDPSVGGFMGTINEFMLGTVTGLSGRQSATLVQLTNGIGVDVEGESVVFTGITSDWSTGVTGSVGATPNWITDIGMQLTDFWALDNVLFDDRSVTGNVTINGGNVSPTLITFNNSSLDYTIGASGAFGITSGLLVKNGGAKTTINVPTSYTGTTTINAGTLEFGAASVLGGGTYAPGIVDNGTLVFNSTAPQTLSGVISGTGSLVKNSTGTLVLTGGSSYSGTTTISGGTLQIGDGTTIGTITSTGAITNNGTLSYQIGTTAFTAARAISGTGSVVKGGTAKLTFTGGVSWSGTTTITAGDLTINNATDATLAGAISGAGSLSTIGTGILTLSGTNTYTGGTNIGNVNGPGVMRANSDSAFGSGTVSIAPGANSGPIARLELINGHTVGNAIAFQGRNTAVTNPTSIGIENISGNNTLSGTLTLNVGGSNYVIQSDSGLLTLSGGTALTTGSTGRTVYLTGAGNGLVSGVAQSTAADRSLGITKLGAGTWTLTGANLFSNPIVAGEGKLVVGGSGTLTGGTTAVPLPTGTYPGGITVTATFEYASTAAQTFTGVVGGTGIVLKSGAGTLTLTGANTFTGTTSVTGGSLVVNGTSLADGSTLDVTTGQVSVTGTETVRKMFLNGVQVNAGTYGANGSGATNIDNVHFSGSGVVNVLLSPGAGYGDWAFTNAGNQTPTQDFDNDGISNMLEYALLTNPNGSDGSVGTFLNGQLKFLKRPDAVLVGDVTYSIEISADLGATDPWHAIATGAYDTNNDTEISYTLPTGAAKSFARLRITLSGY